MCALYTQTHRHTDTQTHTHCPVSQHTDTYTHTHTHTLYRKVACCTHTPTIHTHTHTHTHTHLPNTHTHTHTHTHIVPCFQKRSVVVKNRTVFRIRSHRSDFFYSKIKKQLEKLNGKNRTVFRIRCHRSLPKKRTKHLQGNFFCFLYRSWVTFCPWAKGLWRWHCLSRDNVTGQCVCVCALCAKKVE